jgi:hypothetical protein
MHETYFLSQNLAFLGIYIFDGEFDTFFSYLGGFVPFGIYIYENFATFFPYLGGFERFCIPFMTNLSPFCIYIHEEFTTLFPYPGGVVRLDIYIYIKFVVHLEGTLYPTNFPLRKLEGYYVYYSKVGRFLHLKVGIISLLLLCLMIYINLVHDKFCFMLYGR